MARSVANGAIVSDNGFWTWNGTGWTALVASPPEKAPGLFGGERARLGPLVKGKTINDLRKSTAELVALVAEAGNLAAAEQSLDDAAPNVQVKVYPSAKEFEADSVTMIAAGWRPENQSSMAGHVNAGRTAGKVLLTGGLGLLVGGASRSKDQITVTWARPEK